ncbi:MAG TPA: hypothetical protein VE915_08270 [Actinomycetota bacterium]|nr:hypothetical protein [Actinomycetota bacterium]
MTFEHTIRGSRPTPRGIAVMGEEKAAWFKDPEGNILSVWQVPADWLK